MKFKEFERVARESYERIPEEYKAGIDGVVVSREAPLHPDIPDVWTLGECVTEDYLSDWGGPDTTRSQVVLYWGSFQNLARRDPDFDWDEELWETLTHELRHHLESLAREDDLEGVDYAADETFKRDNGEPYDPWYWQHGERVEPGVYRVERNLYVERAWGGAPAGGPLASFEFDFEGARWRVPAPDELGDVHFVWLDGVVEPPRTLELVLVRRRTWWQEAKRLFVPTRPRVLESEAGAERIDAEG